MGRYNMISEIIPIEDRLIVIFCTGILLLSILASSATALTDAEEEDKKNEIALVEIESSEQMKKLRNLELKILYEYNRYVLIESGEDSIQALQDMGLEVDPLSKRTDISVKGHRFDIEKGEPDLDPELTIDGYEKGTEGIYLVHMLGPVDPEWRSQLEDTGVEILNYVPNYAYEVRMTPEQAGDVEQLDFVDWTGIYQPGYKISEDILNKAAVPGEIKVELVPGAEVGCVKNILEIDSKTALIDPNSGFEAVIDVDDLSTVKDIARMKDVYYISPHREPTLLSEIDSQIIGGGCWVMDDEDGNPDTAYRQHGDHGAYINQVGYTGSGVTVAIADTGLGDGTTSDAGHQDFSGRVVGGYGFGDPSDWADGHSHGTHCAGSVGGDTYNGTGVQYAGMDGNYYASQGLASDSELFSVKIFDDGGSFLPSEYYPIVEEAAQRSDAYVHSNSWGADEGGAYSDSDEVYDQAVREADRDTPETEPMVITVAAGNSGSDTNTIGSPANAKNVISVGASFSYNPDADNYGGQTTYNPAMISDFSSRGWTDDNRVKPDVVAPGEDILSTMTPQGSGDYTEDSRYQWMSGTSMANPAVAGAASVVVDWYEDNFGERPSPAMVKALLINTAQPLDEDNGNTGSIPNRDEGWGRVDLSKLQYPKNDPVSFMAEDQTSLLQTGDIDEYEIHRDKEGVPLNISLVWTDKNALEGDDPTLKNDLNLEVITPGGDVYTGNAFQDGWTPPNQDAVGDFDTSGDGKDDVNNVENVYIHPDEVESGIYKVRVEGFDVPEDGNMDGNLTQDYALAVHNGFLSPEGEPPKINVTRPQGGESWDGLTQENITWQTEDGDNATDTVDLFYSTDGGQSWDTIAEDFDDTGLYTWNVPNVHSQQCKVKARVYDTVGRFAENVTDEFEIVGVPPSPPDSQDVEHFGSQGELVDNGVFDSGYDPWEMELVQDEDEAGWAAESYSADGTGSIHAKASQEGDGTTTQEVYWEQEILPVSTELTINGAFYNEVYLEDPEECEILDSTVEIAVHDTQAGWETIYSEDEIVREWTEFGPDANYTPSGVVDKVKAYMRGEAEGYTDTSMVIPIDRVATLDLWMDEISVVASDNGMEHNMVDWTASPDDPENISHYNIYRSQNESGPWDTPLTTIDADGSYSYSYFDELKGQYDNTYWWYLVRAVGTNGLEEDNIWAVREPVPGNEPSITITSPNGGEAWLPERDVEITWTTTAGDDPVDVVDLWYSTDAGEEWKVISKGISDTGSYIWTLPNETSDECLIRARAWDSAGRISQLDDSDDYFEIVDPDSIEEPEIEVVSPEEDSIFTEAEVTVEWVSNNSDYHEVKIDNEEWADVGMDTSYTFQSIEDGYHNVFCRATGEADVQVSDSVSFTVDTTPPSIEITGPAEGEVFDTGSVTVQWEGSDETVGVDHYEVRIEGNDWIDVGNDTEYTFEGIEDGEHTVEVKAVDEAGNSDTKGLTFMVDTTPPSVEITSPDEGELFSEDAVTVRWSSENEPTSIQKHELLLNGEVEAVDEEGDLDSYELSGLEDGEYTVKVSAEDEAGNVGEDSVSFMIDTQAPGLEISSPEEGSIFGEDSVTVEWVGTAHGSDIDHYEVQLDRGSWMDVEDDTAHTFEDLQDGNHTAEVKAIDEAGNEALKDLNFVVDTKSPTIEILEPLEDEMFCEDAITIRWTGEKEGTEIVKYEIRIDEGEWIDKEKVTEHTYSGVEDGNHSVEVRVEDEAGNEAVDRVSFLLDTSKPVLEIVEPSEDGKTFESGTVTVSWDSEPKGTNIVHHEVRLREEGEWENIGNETTYTFEGLEDGEYTVDIRTTDEAGNVVTESKTFTVETSVISGYWWLLPLILIAAVVILLIGFYWKKRREPESEQPPPRTADFKAQETEGAPKTQVLEKKIKKVGKEEKKESPKSEKEPRESEEKEGEPIGGDVEDEDEGAEPGEVKDEGPEEMEEEPREMESSTWAVLEEEEPKESIKSEEEHPSGEEPTEEEVSEEEEEPSEEIIECPVCGREVSPDAEKCWACGEDLTEEEDEE
ncbi:MAG: S8 family serine peptidase [Candidatus Aenigmatarchaeota archaeon]